MILAGVSLLNVCLPVLSFCLVYCLLVFYGFYYTFIISVELVTIGSQH